jgi:hypothetical protein
MPDCTNARLINCLLKMMLFSNCGISITLPCQTAELRRFELAFKLTFKLTIVGATGP